MKIMFACNSLGSGGGERVLSNLSNFLSLKGHKIFIFPISSSDAPFYSFNPTVKLVNIKKGKIKYFSRIFAIRQKIKEIKPDVIVAFFPHVISYLIAALIGIDIPIVVSERNDPSKYKLKFKILNKINFQIANWCVFQTSEAQAFYGNKIANKSSIIFNPIDIKKRVCESQKPVAVSVGRFVEQKNFYDLINAFSIFHQKHKDYELHIYGDGPLKAEIEQYVLTNNYYFIKLLGEDLNWIKKEIDSEFFILSSKYEGMPNALAEALCFGMKAVSYDCPVGGPKELSRIFDSLILADSMNVNSLANALEKIITLKPKHSYNSELEISKISNDWLSVFKKVVKK